MLGLILIFGKEKIEDVIGLRFFFFCYFVVNIKIKFFFKVYFYFKIENIYVYDMRWEL